MRIALRWYIGFLRRLSCLVDPKMKLQEGNGGCLKWGEPVLPTHKMRQGRWCLRPRLVGLGPVYCPEKGGQHTDQVDTGAFY